MHRSGTSAVSRVLSLLGVTLPANPMPPGPDNPLGFWESEAVTRLNDEILAAGGSSWADWSRFETTRVPDQIVQSFQPRMEAVLREEYADAAVFVLKDPRLSRVLPFWLPAFTELGISPTVLITLRHPAAVARSLSVRNGFTAEFSLLLWLRHLLDAERSTRGMTRHFIRYDKLLADWRDTMADVGEGLALKWPVPPEVAAAEITQFLDDDLNHATDENLAVPSAYGEVWARHTWSALCMLEAGGPPSEALTMLDRVGAQFDDACRLFGSRFLPPKPRPDLRSVTLCAADSHAVSLTLRAMRLSAGHCRFGDAILFTDAEIPPSLEERFAGEESPVRVQPIPPLQSRAEYSAFVIRELVQHVTTSHVLIVQWDGWIVDPSAWDAAFLDYDYVGAPWGRYNDGMDVGNGGFSLRSRRLMEVLQLAPFAPVAEIPEDELIGRVWRPMLEQHHGIRFAPPEIAARFSCERVLPNGLTFGFHGLFNLWRYVNDTELARLLALLPANALRGREYAELVALCFLANRVEAVRMLVATWKRHVGLAEIEASLMKILPDAHQVSACLADRTTMLR
jgi:hypothetical protein